MFDFLATEPHYIDHLLPVYNALPEYLKGTFYTYVPEDGLHNTTVVASYGDYCRTEGKVVYFEHGVGLTYNNDHPSYAGGRGKDRVVLFMCVNQVVADRNKQTYPHVRSVVVGSPKMDYLLTIPKPINEKPKVCFSWHWDCHVVPETGTAFYEYKPIMLHTKKNTSVEVYGHGHPRDWWKYRGWYKQANIPSIQHFEDVVKTCDIYVCDNSSTIYEWAALGRPVIVINGSMYSKKVHYGLRFWDLVPGLQVDAPTMFDSILNDTVNSDNLQQVRRDITSIVYPYLGYSVDRCVDVLSNHK